MNLLFLTIPDIPSISRREIYPDLLRAFVKNGDKAYIVCSCERRKNATTELIRESGAEILRVKIGNITETGLVEKGISTVMINNQYKEAIKKYFPDVRFDLILYSTPPITLVDCIRYIKKRDGAKTYLLLKDIFPQNAVDLGMMSKSGIKSLLYKYFRRKEKKLYAISDHIGCMSQANVDYVIDHNPEVDPSIVEVCPNSVEPIDMSVDDTTRVDIREKYGIPVDKKVFVYGGNLGKPQGIDFLIRCLESQKDNNDVFFLIVGDGTEFEKLDNYVKRANQKNLRLMKRLPKNDYDIMVGACDVGMIFLDHRFTIPNFPSRLLAYMQARVPVLAVTDPNSDIGKTIVDGGFGWWCESNDVIGFNQKIYTILNTEIPMLREIEGNYLNEKYDVKLAYEIIMNHMAKNGECK